MRKASEFSAPQGPKSGLPKGGPKDCCSVSSSGGGSITKSKGPGGKTGFNNSPTITKTMCSDEMSTRSVPSVENKKLVKGPVIGKGKK